MRKIYRALFVVGFILCCSSSIVHAILFDFIPAAPSVAQGQPFSVALAISGLGDHAAPSLAAFDVDVLFDPGLLAFNSAIFGDPILGDQLDLAGFGTLTTQDIPSPGRLNLAELSFDSPSDLDTLQAGSFTLATITFDGLANGVNAFALTVNQLADANGDPLATPEPGTIALSGVGLASLLVYRWFRRHRA